MNGNFTFEYIMGGISQKTGRPYLKVSNGRKELFVNFKKDHGVTDTTFADFEEGDEIVLNVSVIPGSETVTFISA